MTKVYIGLDGGGTHTTGVTVRPDGTVIRRTEGPGLNYLNDGLACCIGRLQRITALLTEGVGAEEVSVCAGLAALDGPAPPEILAAFRKALPAGWTLRLESDLTVALTGHTLGKPGLMAVCGTGSMALTLDREGQTHAAGGWGWKMGDPGSGYALAREGLEQALYALEAEGRETPLLAEALLFFGAADAREMIGTLYAEGQGPDALAAFGAAVIRQAEEGEPEAETLIRRQMARLAALAGMLLRKTPEARERVGLYGGIFQHSALARNLFAQALEARSPGVRAELIQREPALGAVILEMLREGTHPGELPEFTEEQT